MQTKMAKFEWNGLRMRCYRVVHSSATPASRLVHSRSGLSVRMLDSVVLSSQYYTIIISAKQEDLATFQNIDFDGCTTVRSHILVPYIF